MIPVKVPRAMPDASVRAAVSPKKPTRPQQEPEQSTKALPGFLKPNQKALSAIKTRKKSLAALLTKASAEIVASLHSDQVLNDASARKSKTASSDKPTRSTKTTAVKKKKQVKKSSSSSATKATLNTVPDLEEVSLDDHEPLPLVKSTPGSSKIEFHDQDIEADSQVLRLTPASGSTETLCLPPVTVITKEDTRQPRATPLPVTTFIRVDTFLHRLSLTERLLEDFHNMSLEGVGKNEATDCVDFGQRYFGFTTEPSTSDAAQCVS